MQATWVCISRQEGREEDSAEQACQQEGQKKQRLRRNRLKALGRANRKAAANVTEAGMMTAVQLGSQVWREATYVPALLKIFDEILVTSGSGDWGRCLGRCLGRCVGRRLGRRLARWPGTWFEGPRDTLTLKMNDLVDLMTLLLNS